MTDARQIAGLRIHRRRLGHGAQPALKHDIHRMLAPAALEALTIRAMLIRGSETQPVIAGSTGRPLVARLPNASDRVIAGAGHMAPVPHPDAVAEASAA